MTRRIFYSICLVALTVFLASVILFMGGLYEYFSDIQQEQLKMQTNLAAQGVNHEGMDFFHEFEATNYRITWIDTDGNVLYDSRSDTAEMENHLEREEIRKAVATGYGESRRYSVTLLQRSLYCAQMLKDGTILRLSIPQNSALTVLLGIAQPIGLIFAVTLILSVALAVRVSQKIVDPINKMNLDQPLSNESYDELAPFLKRIGSQQQMLRKQEAALLQAEQMRREFTANVSHELKTPLHSISGYAELLKNDMVRGEDVIPFSTRIYEETQRMIRLVEDIISLSRLDEGAKDMERESVDLYELAQEAVKSLEPQAEAAGVTLELRGTHTCIYGISQLLYGIIYNLVDNGVKYNRENGTVTVEIQSAGKEALLSVRDTGIGIAAEHRERIFERFYRIDKSHSRRVGGTGLGLSIVKHAVKIHDGQTEVHSIMGEGTEVTIRFPGVHFDKTDKTY
ncbi:MAG: PAS domain-containing sensor histidine kinase [Lachnospiraceae bacterium]|jgi:two-component system phosphate regulon sensor histidine kinase PhoR|nr:PAS domain-containing sensor histidine kinase [Lachnospiraceae bacterium]